MRLWSSRSPIVRRDRTRTPSSASRASSCTSASRKVSSPRLRTAAWSSLSLMPTRSIATSPTACAPPMDGCRRRGFPASCGRARSSAPLPASASSIQGETGCGFTAQATTRTHRTIPRDWPWFFAAPPGRATREATKPSRRRCSTPASPATPRQRSANRAPTRARLPRRPRGPDGRRRPRPRDAYRDPRTRTR